ncbi:MAG: DUF5721 family protein [Lachnospiraceae bacterium]
MISLEISNVRTFMSRLLMQDVFDTFDVVEASVSSFCNFEISGRANSAWFAPPAEARTASPAEEPDNSRQTADAPENGSNTPRLISWKKLRPYVWNVIRGEKTPLKMKIILACAPQQITQILRTDPACSGIRPDQVSGMFLNITFDKAGLFLTTGTAMKTFSMDRSAENAFDKAMSSFLSKIGIESDSSAHLN